jgi:hypothetical protein
VHQEHLGTCLGSCFDGPSRKLREKADDDNYLESIKNAKLEVEDLANFITEKLGIQLSPSDDEVDN